MILHPKVRDAIERIQAATTDTRSDEFIRAVAIELHLAYTNGQQSVRSSREYHQPEDMGR